MSARIGFALVLCSSWVGWADNFEEAKRHFRLGVAHYAQGEHARAIEEFETSYNLNPVPEALHNIALAHKSLGHFAEAIISMRRYQSEAALRPSGISAARKLESERMVAELRGRIGVVSVSANVDRAEVRIDGRVVGTTPVSDWPLDPGSHRIELWANGYAGQQKELSVQASREQALRFELTSTAQPQVAQSAPASTATLPAAALPAPDRPSAFGKFVRTPHGKATLGLAAVGVASLVAAAATGGLALSIRTQYDASCTPTSPCNTEQFNTGHALAISTDVLIAVGAASCITAVIVGVTRPRQSRLALEGAPFRWTF